MPTRSSTRHPIAGLDTAPSFDTSTALAMLDGMINGDLTPLPGAASAWDAAWIACLTNSPRWTATARDEFLRMGFASNGTPVGRGSRVTV